MTAYPNIAFAAGVAKQQPSAFDPGQATVIEAAVFI
jgi:hypothetical protein